MEPDAKRRRIQGIQSGTGKKQSTLLAFAARRPATPLSADEQSKLASFRTEWAPKVGEGWCNTLLPVLRTVFVMLENDGKQQTHGPFFGGMPPLCMSIESYKYQHCPDVCKMFCPCRTQTVESFSIRTPSVQKTIQQVEEMRREKRIFPPAEDVFKAFRATPLEKVKVVIVGQEPWWQRAFCR